MLTKLIIYFGLKDIRKFVRLLVKLEYGVASSLDNLANDADKSNYFNLANMLREHAQEEYNHGKMLATWCDGKERIRCHKTGRWLSYKNSSGKELAKFPSSGNGKQVVIVEDGEQYNCIFEEFNGISQRYLSLRILLKGKKIIELPWMDRLACMAALESGTNKLYVELCKCDVPDSLRAIFDKIAQEENSHSGYLQNVLRDFSPLPHQEIERWQSRIKAASLGLIFDFANFLMEKRSAS